MKRKSNFDRYLEEQLKDPEFAARYMRAGEAWDVAVQITALRREWGWSQNELAKRVGTSQQQISRIESPSYEGHSLSMLRRVAQVLGARVRVDIQREREAKTHAVAEAGGNYKTGRTVSARQLISPPEPSAKRIGLDFKEPKAWYGKGDKGRRMKKG